MPKHQVLTTLPKGIRTELHSRLRANTGAGFVELSQWLAGKGYQISKSAIHRYWQEFEPTIKGDGDTGERDVQLRMRCVEAVVKTDLETDIIDAAAPVFSWVTTGDRPE